MWWELAVKISVTEHFTKEKWMTSLVIFKCIKRPGYHFLSCIGKNHLANTEFIAHLRHEWYMPILYSNELWHRRHFGNLAKAMLSITDSNLNFRVLVSILLSSSDLFFFSYLRAFLFLFPTGTKIHIYVMNHTADKWIQNKESLWSSPEMVIIIFPFPNKSLNVSFCFEGTDTQFLIRMMHSYKTKRAPTCHFWKGLHIPM